jgi:hypothetical protein
MAHCVSESFPDAGRNLIKAEMGILREYDPLSRIREVIVSKNINHPKQVSAAASGTRSTDRILNLDETNSPSVSAGFLR